VRCNPAASRGVGKPDAFRFLTLALSAIFLNAQTHPVAFEVATVKPAAQTEGGYIAGGPGSRDPGQITYSGTTFSLLVRTAFGLNNYAISGLDSMRDLRFDIHAKVPTGTTKEEFAQMLQNLLIERFQMKIHREMRDVAGYELLAGKGGVHLAAAEVPADPPSPDIPTGRLPLTKDRKGVSQLPPGRNARLVIPLGEGLLRMSARMQSVTDIIEMCSRELARPVVDRTGLTGRYDFNIDFSRRPDPGDTPSPVEDAGTPFLGAFQSQLGFRLEARKVLVEILVIDHVEKVPAEN
jgi:uncharacterized protein (TIGR03435 family)